MDPSSEIVLDVFRRQFYTEAGRPTKTQMASHFSVQVRYMKAQEHKVLQFSGSNGLYAESRLPDASAPSDDFQVIWMPQASFASAQHQMQCEPLSIGLARSGRRYGIRVPAKHFQQLFQKLKPDGQLLAPGQHQTLGATANQDLC